jgi:hypothetical protein
MKKTVTLLSLCLGMTVAAGAQEQPALSYLPVAGDYALGIDATPFLNYTGRLLSNSGATAPTFGVRGQGIYGKYFLKDNRAIRAKLRLNAYSESFKASVRNDEALATNPEATTIDVMKEGKTDVNLSVGYEFRRGHGRVQGFWGGELGLGFGKTNTTYEYGNPMTVANPMPTSGFAGGGIGRILKVNNGMNFQVSVGAFAGVEYFITNHVSLGGEVTVDLAASARGQDEVTSQRVENGVVSESTVRLRNGSDQASFFGVETLTGGNIFLLFYF